MAMSRIRVALLPSQVWIAGTEATLKIKDMETGEIARDRDSGESLYTVTVMLMEDGRAEILKITLPESGLPAGLKAGAMVKPLDLVAIPWARVQKGQLQDGIAFRASSLELAGAAA
ncbi:regulatory protein [Streptomyces sp. MUSC 125]|uniref:SCO3933 family regulatory protein n=1 Tax=unclassified Streptomyces TaxID=2593676 RepID=UPI00057FE0E3|nr:hypothetical protein [Streptomyces sp. MUSC 125]KIE28157.1 regulatory protein [Streptomyces sp. MUSC 125]